MKRTMQEIMEQAIWRCGRRWPRKWTKARPGIGTRTLGRKRSLSLPGGWAGGWCKPPVVAGGRLWAEVKAEQAKAQDPPRFHEDKLCPRCGGRRHLHRWQPLWWLSVFGRIEVQAPYLRCPGEPQPVAGHRPFQELTGLSAGASLGPCNGH